MSGVFVMPNGTVKKLVFTQKRAPGDVIVSTAVIRDLHLCYPGQFITDVRTSCLELWENNPCLTPLCDDDPDVESVPFECPLIDQSNQVPFHYLHACIDFINERLGLRIRPTRFHGDIHLSSLEKSWASQVSEYVGTEIPYWIINAGGKYDITTKWWPHARFQQVVNHFRGRIQFVQIGELGHHHPRLNGVIDLRGRTTLREWVRLVYHAQGVLCGVTAVMHLAAAVPMPNGNPENRACVVLAGGREPVHWEAYPDHRFLARNGLLTCCQSGACWRSRTLPLGDNSPDDGPDNLCEQVVGNYPRCMDMISVREVIDNIEAYFRGGVLKFMTSEEAASGKKGILLSRRNDFDNAPLTIESAGIALDEFLQTPYPAAASGQGRGIVMQLARRDSAAEALPRIRALRQLGCELPIQLWHWQGVRLTGEMSSQLCSDGILGVSVLKTKRTILPKGLSAHHSPALALLNADFQEVVFLDSNTTPVVDPHFLFESDAYKKSGAIFWVSESLSEKAAIVWRSCRLLRPSGNEIADCAMVADKLRCWEALRLSCWFYAHAGFYWEYLQNKAESMRISFHRLQKSYGLVRVPPQSVDSSIRWTDFAGKPVLLSQSSATGQNPKP